jgi:hypothetical protein
VVEEGDEPFEDLACGRMLACPKPLPRLENQRSGFLFPGRGDDESAHSKDWKIDSPRCRPVLLRDSLPVDVGRSWQTCLGCRTEIRIWRLEPRPQANGEAGRLRWTVVPGLTRGRLDATIALLGDAGSAKRKHRGGDVVETTTVEAVNDE